MTSSKPLSLLWFRHKDLRLQDNAALAKALAAGNVIPVFIYAPDEEGEWAPGGASKWWLHHALKDLDKQLRGHGSRLIIKKGSSETTLLKLLSETGANAVYWNRRYEPDIIQRDTGIKRALKDKGYEAHSENSALVFEPHEIANKSGKPFQVYSAFYRACSAKKWDKPVEVELQKLKGVSDWPDSLTPDDLQLLPTIEWDTGFYKFWKPTREGAWERLKGFIDDPVADYKEKRDHPDIDYTSRLSPYLAFGQIGPREIIHYVRSKCDLDKKSPEHFVKEVFWREFAYHLLYNFPRTPEKPLRDDFAKFPWKKNKDFLQQWQKGQTGYPIVDAGMRQLWKTGWMHNRVRMVVASLLVKHLLQPWQEGATWFWDTLVDADLASNTLGWQWTAGCGADAAPYFRVFNPITQGEKFDTEGDYVRMYVPELKNMPTKYIHKPWEADADTLEKAGVKLGENYPKPIIEHTEGRNRALEAFEKLKEERNS